MGIDVDSSWAGQAAEEQAAQEDAGLALNGGDVGYLRESFTGGPYTTKILCRDAFESSVRAFVSLAERKERETGTHCTVRVEF